MHPVARDLLDWYEVHRRRHLPWREQPGPYRTWVSEVMLQQTRVETVVAYFERFMARFPDVESLAAAPLDDVLAAWSGLGYYSRARNLHRAARIIAERRREQGPAPPRNPGDPTGFPDTAEALRELPGIGPYMAGAIASIAFGRDEPAVDGNVHRVLARLFCAGGDRRAITVLARRVLPAGRAGDFNQALMDLGSTICRPRNPDCDRCPVAARCEAFAHGEVDRYPVRAKKRRAPERDGAAAVYRRTDGRVLLARRPPHGLFGGLYELPWALCEGDEPAEVAVRAARDAVGLRFQAGPALGEVRHLLTHMRLVLYLFAVEVIPAAEITESSAPTEWVDPAQPGELGLSTLARRALAVLR